MLPNVQAGVAKEMPCLFTMTRYLKRLLRLACPLTVSILGMVCLQVDARPLAHKDSSTLYLSVESPVRSTSGHVVGDGPYSYRFIVRSPQHIDQPHRRAGYQILLQGGSVFSDRNDVYRGTTDSQGRTATFRTRRPVPLTNWDVRPTEGRGEFGQSFSLSSDDGAGLSEFPYMVNVATGPIYCGYSLPGGLTARYQTLQPSGLSLFTLNAAQCHGLQRRVNAVMQRATRQGRISGLQHLLADRRFEEHHDMLRSKLKAIVLHDGSLAEVQRLRADLLAKRPDASPAKRASILNGLAYQLASQQPPRLVDYANELMDESLSLDMNLYNMDSKGWILYRMGRYEEALDWLNRALASFKTECTKSEKAAYPETLGHRGLVLWTLKRRSEALVDWARANRFTTNGSWTNGLPHWSKIGPLIEATGARLDTLDNEPSTCRESALKTQATGPDAP